MDDGAKLIDVAEHEDELRAFLRAALRPTAEPPELRAVDPLDELIAKHVKRSELLLRACNEDEADVSDATEISRIHRKLLIFSRKQRVNKITNRTEEMRTNVRQTFELKQKLQQMIEQNRVEEPLRRQPMEWIVNDRDAHDANYNELVEALGLPPVQRPAAAPADEQPADESGDPSTEAEETDR
ncbi:hypothetical protein M3Y99_01696300 [Aphelenchoides fujianensis]|nr:hypothetical protein M3Y99_01696300 [Aphelenchoides fujianensis]